MSSKEATKEKKPLWREILEWVLSIICAFFLAVTIKYFVFTPTLVMQNSMTPTILNGERVLINRLVRTFNLEINRGDIVTLEAPISNDSEYNELLKNGDTVKALYRDVNGVFQKFVYYVVEYNKISYIKRVIAIEGDHVVIKDGKLYVNDELQVEDYIPKGVLTNITKSSSYITNDFIVPEGYYFCMGDNREASSDCRTFGCVPKEKIEGKVVCRIWPLTKFGKVGPASDIEKYAK